MIPSRVIEAKRDGHRLTPLELEAFLVGYLEDRIPDYQMAAFLMAACFRGLDAGETDVLVRCMLDSGATLDLSELDGPRVDKHSTGGVGDKVSLVLAPLAAALGMYVPMISGRGLGHTTGTLDKLEAIPGFRTALGLGEFRRVLADVGCAMIGQTEEIAPLDRRLYALRDVTGTVPVIPLIAASIMSKKLAEGLDALVLDVKVGAGAFLPEEERALELARAMVSIGSTRGLATVALLTAMDRPLGRAVGNGLETREAIACLRGEGPPDLHDLVVAEAAEMLRMADGRVDEGSALARARAGLASGAALERFVRLVEAQGGDPRVVDDASVIAAAAKRSDVLADAEGIVAEVEPRALGLGVVRLGGGRTRIDDVIDPSVGFVVDARPGDRVAPGDRLGTVHARDAHGIGAGARILRDAIRLGEEPSPRPLVSHRIGADDL
jgi:pyrimidine-nucleoside phosphorylase